MNFTNKWYPLLLILVLSWVAFIRTQDILVEWNWVSVFHLSLNLLVGVAILLKLKFTGIIVKIWAGLSIFGGILGLFSVSMRWLIGTFDRVEFTDLVSHIVHVIIGYILYSYWTDSIEVDEGSYENEEILDA